MSEPGRPILWRLHLRSAPDAVFHALSEPGGRARFWARSADEERGVIHFRFANGQRLESRILESLPATRFRLTYFGGSVVTFELSPDGGGGTELTLLEEGAPPAEAEQNRAGWVSVLLQLKAAVDFGVDLRSHDPGRTWDDGFVDG
jgi:uncharacterized protein YndB with AHSA1/START domain